jgi:CDP-glucose 4,6-dehydratase
VAIDSDFWMGRRVLITGHTGFKGAWLSLWLQSLGASVTGLAPAPPTRPSLYELASVGAGMRERSVDVRDAAALGEALRWSDPEVVLHLAAQPMVRRSLRDPATTYEINVMGTVNLLDAIRLHGGDVRAVVVVTSDKCYENPGRPSRPFVEDDRLGGEDPYSSSKVCAELIVAAYRRSFFGVEGGARLASARAGNVIGGGDWGEDRLLPDIVRAVDAGEPLRVRNPQAVRPWQHVLNPLSGYLRLAEMLWQGEQWARAWNFGPRALDVQSVRWIVQRLGELWDGALEWELDEGPNPPEAGYLALDSSDAERLLGWRRSSDLGAALELLVQWHRAQREGEDMRRVSLEQIARFEQDTRQGHPAADTTR